MISAINCSMFECTSTSGDDKTNTGVSKSTRLDPKVKN